ncbi:hypothetical protein LB503_010577 [Fusarium chuoi]|nr:hypothetical protein LB503_010577 [Fusarium chuoi]
MILPSKRHIYETVVYEATYKTPSTTSHDDVLHSQDPFSTTKASETQHENAHRRWRPRYHLMPPTGWLNDPCAPGYDAAHDVYHSVVVHLFDHRRSMMEKRGSLQDVGVQFPQHPAEAPHSIPQRGGCRYIIHFPTTGVLKQFALPRQTTLVVRGKGEMDRLFWMVLLVASMLRAGVIHMLLSGLCSAGF